MIEINEQTEIPEDELEFRSSRSGGPGGQHVNKVSTRVTLVFDLDRSPSLSAAQKTRIRNRLGGRVTRAGLLRVVCGRHRSREANRREAIARFAALLAAALERRVPRKKTGVPVSSRRQRIEEKKKRSRLKRDRTRPAQDD